MYGLIIFLHVIICILLAIIILMQSGKGGGLTENFAAAESLFGATTNTVLVKATGVLACLFIVTSLSLAFLSSKSNKSLIAARAAKNAKTASEQAAAAKAAVLPSEVPSDIQKAVSEAAPETKPTKTDENPQTDQQPKEPEPAGSVPTPGGSQ